MIPESPGIGAKIDRRTFLQAATAAAGLAALAPARGQARPPNILFAMADDWSYPHAGAYGCRWVKTPAFDRVATDGVLFNHAFCPAPQCSPCRASILTGRNLWQNQEAGTHSSVFPQLWPVYPDLLEAAGYAVGTTGKAWGPGDWRRGGWGRNPAGSGIGNHTLKPPAKGIASRDYAANFADFLAGREPDSPFCFWYGGQEPHRGYEPGSGIAAGKDPSLVDVPGYLPDRPEVRSDLLDYALEVEWFDSQLGLMLDALERAGELDRTIVVVTGDNGLPFPRAKANLYDAGCRAPLAIRWPELTGGGRTVDDLTSLIDLAPTYLAAAGLEQPETITGRSLRPTLGGMGEGLVDATRNHVLLGRERHTHARRDNLGYPARAIRTADHLLIWNLKPALWPAGDPDGDSGYYDIDGGPTKSSMMEHRDDPEVGKLWELAVGKRPEFEFYDLTNDPDQLVNRIDDPAYRTKVEALSATLQGQLAAEGDPRMGEHGDIFDSYPRIANMRPQLGGFAEQGLYNPAFLQPGQTTW